MEPLIVISYHGQICHVVNNNPATRNSLSLEYISGLCTLLEGFREKIAGRPAAVILSGAEGFFCSGGDLSGLQERAQGHYAARRALVDQLNDLVRAIRTCPCPVIAAVEGGAAGAGAAIALACDMICAAKISFLASSYVKIGLTPDAGTSVFLSAGVPRWLAAELLFTGDKIAAERLYQLGVVNHLTEDGAAIETAFEVAGRLEAGPKDAIMRAKTLLAQAAITDFDDQLEAEADNLAQALGGAEAAEGISAFINRRAPDFPKE